MNARKLHTTFLLILVCSFNCALKAQTIEHSFSEDLSQVISAQPAYYDSIHQQLKSYAKDTSMMHILIKESVENNYLMGECYGWYQIGVHYAFRSRFNRSIGIHQQCVQKSDELLDVNLKILCFNMIGMAHRRWDKVNTALDYHQQALELAENVAEPSHELKLSIASSENSIGNCYLVLNQFEQAIKQFEKAKKMEAHLGNDLGLAINNQNIGHSNEELGNLDSAYHYYQISLEYNNKINSDIGRVICKTSMSQVHIKKGEYQKAIDLLKSVIPIARASDDQFHLAFCIVNYGWANMEIGNLEIAETYLKEALAIAEEFDLQDSYVETNDLLSRLESKKGNYKEALDYFKRSAEKKDFVINNKNNQYINDLVYKHDAVQKNIQIKNLANENEIVKLKLKQNQNIMALGLVGTLLLTLALLAYFRQRQKRKDQEIINLKRRNRIKTLETLLEGEEKERHRIAKELHDGINGDLSAIKYKLNSIGKNGTGTVDEAIDMIDKSCEQVRAISHNLIPPSLERYNLLEALEEYCNYMNESNDLTISFQHLGDNVLIEKNKEVNIFRIIQELVNNGIKHAEANEITVQISNRNDNLQITVEDDGKGFDPDKVQKRGIGLANIESRIEYLNANLDFESNENGSSYVIEIDTQKTYAH